jgi:homoserine dehydrogenase
MDVRLAVTGFGNVGQGLATLLQQHSEEYVDRYGVRLLLTGVADSGGGAVDPAGLEPADLLQAKQAHGTVAAAARGRPGLRGEDFLSAASGHVFVEAASTNFIDAEPGWSYIRSALQRDMDVVLASKGALALHWRDLMTMAAERGRIVFYSATVGAPLPSLQVADRALLGAEILAFEGILNGTTHQILTAMAQGATYEEGVRQAQEIGIAETDPTLDVDGWDAAAKVAIVANAVFGANLRLDDVARQGIRGVTAADLEHARSRGQRIKLIGRAQRRDRTVTASVAPEPRDSSDALGRLRGDDMGIVFLVEPLGRMAITIESGGHGGGISTAMTVLRDVLNLARDRAWSTPSPG